MVALILLPNWKTTLCSFSMLSVHSLITCWHVSLTCMFSYIMRLISFISKLTSMSRMSTDGDVLTLSHTKYSRASSSHSLNHLIISYIVLIFISSPFLFWSLSAGFTRIYKRAWASANSFSLKISVKTLIRVSVCIFTFHIAWKTVDNTCIFANKFTFVIIRHILQNLICAFSETAVTQFGPFGSLLHTAIPGFTDFTLGWHSTVYQLTPASHSWQFQIEHL